MDASDLIVATVGDWASHGNIIDVGLSGFLALLAFFRRHVDPTVLDHTMRVQSTTIFRGLSLLHVDVSSLWQGSCRREVFAIPWVVLTNIFAPVRIYDHLPSLGLSLINNTVVIAKWGWVIWRNRLARGETSIASRYHYAVYPVELDLVLLVQRVKIETYLAIVHWLVLMGKINVFVCVS